MTPLISLADDHLINHAPRKDLNRVRKAELFRLWRVSGLADDDADESEIHKNALIDGLLDAVSGILPAAQLLRHRSCPAPN